MEKEDIEKAFNMIHGNLRFMPKEFCSWKKESIDGRTISKSLSTDYRPTYSFVKNKSLKENISQLRMALDYHYSLYNLHKPGLLFRWQHKLVLGQISAGICEGLLYDLLEYKIDEENHERILKVIGKQKINQPNLGLGSLLDIFYCAKIIDNKWFNYLTSLKNLRDTVHPKSLNDPRAGFDKNPILKNSPEELIKNIDSFAKKIGSLY